MRRKVTLILLFIVSIFLFKMSIYAKTDIDCDKKLCNSDSNCTWDALDQKCVFKEDPITESQYTGSHSSNSGKFYSSCYQMSEDYCEVDDNYSCIWVTGKNTPGYCNVDKLQYVKCGDAFDIPEQAPRIMSFAINLLKIATPIILIITGIITLVKAVAASKDDEIKKAQSLLIKKVIASAFVFFVVTIVQFVVVKVADSADTGGITSCMACFLNNDCDKSVYFKTKVGDEYVCHSVSNPKEEVECGENQSKGSSIDGERKKTTEKKKG